MIERPSCFPHSPTELEIDLDALAANWRFLQDRVAPARCSAVVKADGYGLGAGPVAAALAAAGCRLFFTAHLDEAIAVRDAFSDAGLGTDIEIGVLNGLFPGDAAVLVEYGLFPVLNDLGQIEAWRKFCSDRNQVLPAAIQTDSGMCRLGLPWQEVRVLSEDPSRLDGIEMRYLMSHMASADTPSSPQNRAQLDLFRGQVDALPAATSGAMLAASSAIFLGPDWYFDWVRPGVALYGVAPNGDGPNPMRPVVRLRARIVQLRDVDVPQTVGYGASYVVRGPSRIATVAVGYADGYLRSLSSGTCGHIGARRVPLAGRVSMDLLTFDVTDVPEAALGDWIELIGEHHDVDAVASDAGTIGYEILTSLGRRYRRTYIGGAA